VIHVVTDPSVGGTFLTWSIYWLAGHHNYFLLETNKLCDLVNDPVGKVNAHAFIPNQPNKIFDCDPIQFTDFVERFSNNKSKNFNILYYHTFPRTDTTEHAIKYSNINATKLVVVDSSQDVLYHCSFRKRTPHFVSRQIQWLFDNKDIQNFLIKTYFNDSKKIWEALRLTEIWDLREFLALNFRPFELMGVYETINKAREHYLLPGRILWNALDEEVVNLFKYLNLDINQLRFDQWKEIYKKWKSIHHQRLLFSTHFENFISGILNNWNINIERFNLDIEQEAAIQHTLIYRHNLNLKTWQLEKFVNTKQLHNLLEPNRHLLSS